MNDTATPSGSEKWLEIQAWGLLFVDGRCTECESASKTAEELAGLDSGLMLELKGRYFYNVYLVDKTPESVTVKVGDRTATLRCGESLKVTMPLSYAYSDTEVTLLGQSQLDEQARRKEESRRREAERQARRGAPFDPDNYDYYDDEDRRKEYAMGLFGAMKEASTPEAWRAACDKAWEMRRVFRCYESVMIADYCYYPSHARVDTAEALRWYRHAEETIPAVSVRFNPAPAKMNLLYENLVRLLYLRGQEDEAEKYYQKAMGMKGCESVECPHLEYVHDVLKWDIAPERIERLLDKRNYAAVNTAILLTYPLTYDDLDALTPEARARMQQICDWLVRDFERSGGNDCSAVAYPAFLSWLSGEDNFFDGSLWESLVKGAADDFWCILYEGLIFLFLADSMKETDMDEEQRKTFKGLRDGALTNLQICARQGNARACRFYTIALEALDPDAPDLPLYTDYYNRLKM